MKRDEQHRLLNDLVGGEEMSDFRQASLAEGLGALRRRNRRRQAVRYGALAIIPVLLALTVFFSRRPGPTEEPVSRPIAATNPLKQEPAAQPIAVITDEELFALFPDRSPALLGPPGKQQLVFLDKARKNVPPDRF